MGKLYEILPENKQPMGNSAIVGYKPCCKKYIDEKPVLSNFVPNRISQCGVQTTTNGTVSCPKDLCDLCETLGVEKAISTFLELLEKK